MWEITGGGFSLPVPFSYNPWVVTLTRVSSPFFRPYSECPFFTQTNGPLFLVVCKTSYQTLSPSEASLQCTRLLLFLTLFCSLVYTEAAGIRALVLTEEEKRTPRSPRATPSPPSCPDEPEEKALKKIRRKIKNKVGPSDAGTSASRGVSRTASHACPTFRANNGPALVSGPRLGPAFPPAVLSIFWAVAPPKLGVHAP